jgi:serine/threonine protein kinase
VPSAAPQDLALTRTGELVGTPLYMAPEQFQAQHTDARTDQFAFCVALYQALYGAHPFGGGAMIDALVTNVLAGAVQPPPAKHDVPAWLRRVLLRGLSVEPAARWPRWRRCSRRSREIRRARVDVGARRRGSRCSSSPRS